MKDFKDISPYEDNEVPGAIVRLKANNSFLSKFSPFFFPRISSFLPFLGKFLFKLKFTKYFGSSKSVKDFQQNLAPFFTKMIESTTSGFSISGEENLTNRTTLFIGNHRDIALDASFLNYALHQKGLNTARIAIGDNLLDKNFAEELMRLNKSFVVHRNIKGIKETYKKLHKLSSYIYKSIVEDSENIWIAQREGRASDGNDLSDAAVLKMLFLSNRKKMKIKEWLKKVNLTPVVISYEFDPLDVIKRQGNRNLVELEKKEKNERDISDLINGIAGYKGGVHLHICKPVLNEISTFDELVVKINDSIQGNYKLWPSNYFAVNELSKMDKSYEPYIEANLDTYKSSQFMNRFNDFKDEKLQETLRTYARPVINKKKAN